ATVKALFRRGHPESRAKPAPTASIRRNGGWFGKAGRAPDLPLDTAILTEDDLRHYTEALGRNGFLRPAPGYMTAAANADHAQTRLRTHGRPCGAAAGRRLRWC